MQYELVYSSHFVSAWGGDHGRGPGVLQHLGGTGCHRDHYRCECDLRGAQRGHDKYPSDAIRAVI